MTQNTVNVFQRFLPSGPSEWPDPDERTLAKLRLNSLGLMTPEQFTIEQLEIVGQRWYLLENSYGWTCSHCGTKRHKHMTYKCLERPYAGMDDALMWLESSGIDRMTAEGMLMGEKMKPLTPADAHQKLRAIHDKTGVDLAAVYRQRQLDAHRDRIAVMRDTAREGLRRIAA